MLQSPDTAIVQTLVAGGVEGTPFNDLVTLGWPAKNPLNMEHPIEVIEVRHGRLIDALNVTYLLKDGTTKEIKHGAQTGGTSTKINLTVDETVIDVCGKAGYDSWYKRVVVRQISFAILNKKTGELRIAGPFGTGDQGTLYHDSGTAAFAGWETSDTHAGLAGLSFLTSKTWE